MGASKVVNRTSVVMFASSVLCVSTLVARASDDVPQQDNKKVQVIKKIRKEISGKEISKSVTMGSDNGGPVTAISKHLVESQRGVTNAESILNSSPGVNVTTSNPIGVRVHTSIRGFKGSQIGYTYDNLPITNILNGGLTGGDSNDKQALYNVVPVTLGQIGGVKIQFGPTPTNINSFGALGGTVEYLPRLPTNKFYVKTFAGYGSFNTRRYGAEVNTGYGKGLGKLFVRFSSRQTNNYFENTPNRLYSYYAAYVLPSVSGRSEFTAIYLQNNTNGFVPAHMPTALTDKYGPTYQFPLSDTYAEAKGNSSTAILGYKTFMTDKILLDTKMYYQYQDFDEVNYESPDFYNNSPYVGNVPYFAFGNSSPYNRYRVINQTIGVAPSAKIFLGENYQYQIDIGGLGLFTLAHDSSYLLPSRDYPQLQTVNDLWDEHQHRLVGTVYVQGKLKPTSRLTIYPGVKEEVVSSLMNDILGAYEQSAFSGNTYKRFSPYLGVDYKLTDEINLYSNFGINYKVPNMSAYYAADQTNPPAPLLISPEKVETFQFGAQYKAKNILANIAFYRQNFTNVFSSYYDLNNGLSYQFNFGSAKYQGMNIGADYKFNDVISGFANYSLQAASYTSSATGLNGVSVAAGDPKQYTPTYLANVGVNGKYDNLSAALSANFVGSQYIGSSGGSPTTSTIRPYKIVNLSITYNRKINYLDLKSAKISLNITNLLNSHSYIFEKQFNNTLGTGVYNQGQPMLGRFISADLALTF